MNYSISEALKNVYNSSKVIFTNDRFYRSMTHQVNDKKFIKLKKNIKIKRKYINWSNNFFKKNLSDKKVLGVHYRGTSYKTAANHPNPPTKTQILNKNIALCRVDIHSSDIGTDLEVGKLDGHQKRISAKVVNFPFYDPTKSKVRG